MSVRPAAARGYVSPVGPVSGACEKPLAAYDVQTYTYSARPPVHGHFYRRNLPHWDVSHATYFVTMCLAGSLPARGALSLRPPATPPVGAGRAATSGPGSAAGRSFVDYDRRLDKSSAVRWFADPRLAAVVKDAILWGVGTRYDLFGYVVMPSHVHWVFSPRAKQGAPGISERLRITIAFKRHTAQLCNRLLGRRGRFWQAESYDHVVRSDAELERIIRYVEHNPVRAGLCAAAEQWEFSSANDRGGTV